MDNDLKKVPLEVSARHVHLSQKDQDALFGEGYVMNVKKELSQTGQWAAEDKVTLKASKRDMALRVLGPCRKQTQIELSRTDCIKSGIEPALRLSGDIAGTPGCTLVGPAGEVVLEEGVIVARRHIHISDKEAEERGLVDGDIVSVKIGGDRGLTFHEVNIRVRDSFRLNVHLDTDEGNAAWLDVVGNEGEIIK
ncbi:MAG: phosphate propanoyltransferase [Patescibacteria group bacterium]|nr:phosphate propanoyltransferase [Patescibacteria group bacterium]